MKFSELTPKNVEYIIECVKTLLKRMCINVDITMEAKTNRCGEEYVDVNSSEIMVVPAIVHNLRVIGNGYLTKVENCENCYDFYIHLNYRYDMFSGGSNGTEIGTVHFRINNDGYTDIRFVGMNLTAYVSQKF